MIDYLLPVFLILIGAVIASANFFIDSDPKCTRDDTYKHAIKGILVIGVALCTAGLYSFTCNGISIFNRDTKWWPIYAFLVTISIALIVLNSIVINKNLDNSECSSDKNTIPIITLSGAVVILVILGIVLLHWLWKGTKRNPVQPPDTLPLEVGNGNMTTGVQRNYHLPAVLSSSKDSVSRVGNGNMPMGAQRNSHLPSVLSSSKGSASRVGNSNMTTGVQRNSEGSVSRVGNGNMTGGFTNAMW